MTQRFYQLNSYNNPSIKNTYVSLLYEELQNEMYKMITRMQKDIINMTVGEIHRTCLTALDKLCASNSSLKMSLIIEAIMPSLQKELLRNQV